MDTHNEFRKGRESLLQALAILKENEEFKGQYGQVPEVMQSRREKSISLLCEMLVRVKKESDVKGKCMELLEDVSKSWKLMLDDRRKLVERISEMEKNNEDLKKKNGFLEREIKELKERSSASMRSRYDGGGRRDSDGSGGGDLVDSVTLDRSILRGSSEEDVEQSRTMFMSEKSYSDGSNVNDENRESRDEQRNQFYSSHFNNQCNNGEDIDRSGNGVGSSQASNKPNFTHALLTGNPYENLNREYYNPTQFFQRQSSTFRQTAGSTKGRGRGKGSRGGGTNRRKSESGGISQTSGTSNKKAKRGGKATALTEKKVASEKETVNITIENLNDGEESNSASVVGGEDRSPENGYYDLTNSFLDETELRDLN